MAQLRTLLLLKSVRSLLVVMFLVAEIYSQEILTTVDRRSLKGKIDPANNKPVLVEITEDGYRYGGVRLVRNALVAILNDEMDKRMPLDRIVFVTTESETPFKSIVDLLVIGRTLDVDDFSLGRANAGLSFDPRSAVQVKIVLEEPEPTRPKPDARFLGVDLTADGSLSLNGKRVTETALVSSLKQTFVWRKKRRVFTEGSRDVEKTVFVRATLSNKFEHVLKTLKTVQSSGARPIALEIDWLDP